MKNIKLTKKEFEDKLYDYLKNNCKNTEINKTPTHNDGLRIDITIPGEKSFIFTLWEKQDGLTIQPQGQNIELANKIIDLITKDTQTVVQKKLEFLGVTKVVYDNIKSAFEGKSDYKINDIKCSKVQNNLIIEKGNFKIIIEHYHTTHRCFLVGKSTCLWDEVFIELTSNLNLDVKRIIELSIHSTQELESVTINYDDGILDGLLHFALPDSVLNNERLITETEKKWLKTTMFLLFTEIQLPEYFATIASAIKVIEGVLNKIIILKGIPKSKDFQYFDSTPDKKHWYLKSTYASTYFSNNTCHINLINEIYTFIQTVRHKYFHNDGVDPAEIKNKQIAETIFQTILELLKKTDYCHIL